MIIWIDTHEWQIIGSKIISMNVKYKFEFDSIERTRITLVKKRERDHLKDVP